MIIAPEIDPIAVSIGPLSVRWYGLMYLVGFLAGGLLGVYRAKKPGSGWQPSDVWDLLFYIALGVVVGGRLGYGLFYQTAWYFQHPWELLYIWTGGMSFHGGVIGVLVSIFLFSRHRKRTVIDIGDFTVPLIPIGLMAGRIGNFINQELWGRVTDAPWGVVFATADAEPRHPSQLYEATLEGLVLFTVLWIYSSRPHRPGAVSGLFLTGYAVARIISEFFREPDAHLGPIALGWLTMGQLLSIPMLAAGLFLLLRRQN